MFKRSIVLVLIVCVFSFFSINNISYAGKALNTWQLAETDVSNAKSIMETERNQYHSIQGDLEALIGEWDDAEIAKASHNLLSVLAVTGAIVSVASGGSLYPAAYVFAVTAAKAMYTQSKYDVQKEKYLTSMSALLSLMDTARANVEAAYNGGFLTVEPHGGYPGIRNNQKDTPGYDPEYDAYLSMAVSHLNGYEYYVGKYENKVTLTFTMLEDSVKGGGTSGYYHRGFHTGDTHSKEDHNFTKFMTFGDFVVNPDLPYNYQCKGNYSVCGAQFRTPYEAKYAHIVKCGDGENVDDEAVEKRGQIKGHHEHIVAVLLSDRSVTAGCGRDYYWCADGEEHQIQYCDKPNCKEPFRRCMPQSLHGGSSHNNIEADIPTSSPTPSPTPTYHVCGVHEDWQSGDHSLQASCLETDSHGQYCTETNFYACQSHTHVYPAPPTVVAPVWSDIPDPYNLTVADSFYLDLSSYVTGSPTFTRNGGVIPAGLSFSNGVISGTVTSVESRSFRFTATNSAGSVDSEWIRITVTAAQ